MLQVYCAVKYKQIMNVAGQLEIVQQAGNSPASWKNKASLICLRKRLLPATFAS
jgi:hypothetical protein